MDSEDEETENRSEIMGNRNTPTLRRRQFCRLLGTVILAAGLSACSGLQPRPFTTGKTVSPPWGCADLQRRDPRGDC